MRITIVLGAFFPVPTLLGGAVEKVWLGLGEEFARQGHSVTILSRCYRHLPRREIVKGVEHRRISGFSAPASLLWLKLCDLWYSLRVRPHLPAADILVTNTFWLPLLAPARSRGALYVHVARYPKGQMRWYRRAAALQTVSEPIKQAIIAEVPVRAALVRVVPNPVAERYFVSQLPPFVPTLLYVGRLHPEKGVHVLIEAFAACRTSLNGWRLKIVGPWETSSGGGGEAYARQLRRLAEPCGEAVEFTGKVFDEAKLVAHYQSASVFAYPSLAEKGETFGLAPLEAMAAGCAPIVSSLACFQDFIRQGESGLIFDHRTTDPTAALAVALRELLPDRARIESLRQQAWQRARRYRLPVVADTYLRDFTQLLTASPPPIPSR